MIIHTIDTIQTILACYYFIFGLCIGSFLNVVIYRLPIGLPIAKGRSMCPVCETTLTTADLVPLFSILFLKGKCRHCGCPISLRYPFVECLTAMLFLFCFLTFGVTLHSIIMCIFMCLLIIAWFIDVDHKIIPDRLSMIIIILSIATLYTCPEISLISRLLGGFLVGGGMLLISLLTKGGIGGGDIKLLFASGLLLGLSSNLLAFFLAYLFAAMYYLIPLLRKKIPKHYEIPMAPFFAVALMISALWGNNLIAAYLKFFYHTPFLF